MQRRTFLKTSTFFAIGALTTNWPFHSISASIRSKEYPVLPYDDNKVIRVYDQRVTNYDFSENVAYWKTIDKQVLNNMLAKSLFEISGEKSVEKAWKKILAGQGKSDLAAKKVAIKVNFNNTIRDINTTLNNSPAMISVLAKSLKSAGIKEENICVFDCSRPFPEDFKTEIRSLGLNKIILIGKKDNIAVSDRSIVLSDNIGVVRDGKSIENYPIPQCLMDAHYLVNLHLVKIHSPGVTGSMKNLFGLAGDVAFYMHHKTNITDSNLISDITLNEDIQKRAKLNIAEFIFGGHTPDTINKYTNEEFFPKGIPASLIVSRCPFYHDTVLYNIIKAEYLTSVPVMKRFQKMGPDTWLKNAAEKHPTWKYDSATFVDTDSNSLPKLDLQFKNINYKSI